MEKRFYIQFHTNGFTVCDRVQCTQTDVFPFMSDAQRVKMMNPNYLHGATSARIDRHYREPARYRVQAGTYQFRDVCGAWNPTGSDDLTDRARGYLDTYHKETLYAC